MSNKVTLGGERLGNGKKIKVDLHGWGRSTSNQDRIWRSTMAPGVLVPCFQEIGLNGTTFDIDISTLGHTIPTISPLFGSFKLQVDVFACPIRLYQGLLHNNAVNIGLKMSQVLLPNIILNPNNNTKKSKTNTSSLNNYLGIKGYTPDKKNFWAVPHLAYYDIFKNYYANKQEKNAKVIAYSKEFASIAIKNKKIEKYTPQITEINNFISQIEEIGGENERRTNAGTGRYSISTTKLNSNIIEIEFNGEWPSENVWITKEEIDINANEQLEFYLDTSQKNENGIYTPNFKLNNFQFGGENDTNINFEATSIKDGQNDIVHINDTSNVVGTLTYNSKTQNIKIKFNNNINIQRERIVFWFEGTEDILSIKDFELENIDIARRKILEKTDLNVRVNLNNDLNFEPYKFNFENDNIEVENKKLQGLMLKTYQNDIFNCWLSTEHVELINQISSITPNEDGQITIDALILARKVYNILNRIAISGGTYENWQESVYGENTIKKAESPIYLGGTSAEITFEEVVSTASSENANGQNQPLATLAGKGVLANKKGGSIIYKCEEPTLIMGIVSITPRVDYHQGNKWFMTELDNMDNFHKPGLDGIGFQNLIANNVVWSDSPEKALAKQTAWIHYQTAYNEVFGDFAEDTETSLAHMVLRRDYETDENGEITDFTSYIDPSKYNYAFADDSLTAQNFWIQLGFNVKSRRKMATYEIPNL